MAYHTQGDPLDHVVFLLGSGFSKDVADLPVLAELSEQIRDALLRPKSPPSIRDWIIDRVPESVAANLEEFLTYLQVGQPWWRAPETALAQAAYRHATDLIGHFVDDAWRGDRRLLVGADATELVQAWHKRESTIITYNYDTVVETLARDHCQIKQVQIAARHSAVPELRHLVVVAAEDVYPHPLDKVPDCEFDDSTGTLTVTVSRGRGSPRGIINEFAESRGLKSDFANVTTRNVEIASRKLNEHVSLSHLYQIPLMNVKARTTSLLAPSFARSLQLLKLHGSTNWFHAGETASNSAQLYYRDIREPRDLLERHAEDVGTRDLERLIVPPLLDKSRLYGSGPMRAQWRLASEAIAGAAYLCVIGYSLPPTDLSTSFLLRDALRQGGASLVVFTKATSEGAVDLRQRFLAAVEGDVDRLTLMNVPKPESSVSKVLEWIATQHPPRPAD